MGTIYTVQDSAGLYEALAKAQGGDDIRLASGDYGDLVLNSRSGFSVTFDAEVTITSLDVNNPASFSGMRLDDVSNLTFDNVVFDYTFDSSDYLWSKPFEIKDSDSITISNSLFEGDVASGLGTVDDGYGYAMGLSVTGANNLVLDGNEFTTWHRGLVVRDSTDVSITDNDVHSIRSDGMDFVDIQGITIEGNYIHDFKTSPDSSDHADMIQFWTTGTDTPSTDIVISNNILDIGDGDWTQSIFMRNGVVDTGQAGEEMFYQNILIEQNTILNGHTHGITVGETDGLTIRNNTVLSIDATDPEFVGAPTIRVSKDAVSVTVEQNAVSAIYISDQSAASLSSDSEFSIKNNAYVQNTDPTGVGYYSDIFFASSMSGTASDYTVLPGSMLDTLSAGTSMGALNASPDQLSSVFNVLSLQDTSQTLVFDATHTYQDTGQITSSDATFLWDFGDGTQAQGVIGTHTYATPGQYEVTLTIETEGGQAQVIETATVGVSGDNILSFDSSDGFFKTNEFGEDVTIEGSDSGSTKTGSEFGVDLGGVGSTAEIPKELIAPFFGSNNFEISMSLQSEFPGSETGEVFRIHGSIIVAVDDSGAIVVELMSNSGEKTTLSSTGVVMNDGQSHDVSINFDLATQSVHISVDDKIVGSAAVSSPMPEMRSWDLVFGQPWGGQNFDGDISSFSLDATSSDYAPFVGSTNGFDFLEGTEAEVNDEVPPPSNEDVVPINDDVSPAEDSEAPDDQATLPVLDEYIIDFSELAGRQLRGDAEIVHTENSSYLNLDGDNDALRLGRMTEFEDTEQLSFAVQFRKSETSDEEMRLVWNHHKIALTTEGDSLKVYVGDANNRYFESVTIDNLDINDTDLHEAIVIVDAESDRLQVILDEKVVYEEQDERDLILVDAGGYEWGWRLGGAWNRGELDGEIHDFRVQAEADFVPNMTDDMGLLV